MKLSPFLYPLRTTKTKLDIMTVTAVPHLDLMHNSNTLFIYLFFIFLNLF